MWAKDTLMSPEERIVVMVGVLDNLSSQAWTRVSRGEMGVLGFLSHHGATSPTDLAKSLNVTTARIANTLRTLERKGFVQRRINPDDRRGVIVTITPEGRSFGETQYRAGVAGIRELLAPLTEAERSQLADLIEKSVVAAAEKRGAPLPPLLSQRLDRPA